VFDSLKCCPGAAKNYFALVGELDKLIDRTEDALQISYDENVQNLLDEVEAIRNSVYDRSPLFRGHCCFRSWFHAKLPVVLTDTGKFDWIVP